MAGRPPKYTSEEEVQRIIDDYFANCFAEERPPTVTGLALALDMTRQGLCDYGNKEQFADTIKKGKQRVELFLEERLYSGAPAGVIFNLKNNYKWKDKTEQEVSGNFDIKRIELVPLSDDSTD